MTIDTANHPQTPSLRDTARGVAVRAGILSVVSIVVGAWLFSVVANIASGLVKGVAALLLLAIGGGMVTWEVKRAQRRR